MHVMHVAGAHRRIDLGLVRLGVIGSCRKITASTPPTASRAPICKSPPGEPLRQHATSKPDLVTQAPAVRAGRIQMAARQEGGELKRTRTMAAFLWSRAISAMYRPRSWLRAGHEKGRPKSPLGAEAKAV